MGNFASILDQAGAVLIDSDSIGQITDIYVAAGASATKVALYDGPTTASPLLFIDKIAASSAHAATNCKIQFTNGGVYALVDANTEALIVHGEWAKLSMTNLLSGG